MADWRRALSKDEIPAAFRNVYGDRTEKPLSVQMADIGVDVATPLGTITDIQTELEKEEPNYAMIAGMAGLELLGPAAGAVQMAAKSGNKGLLQKILGSLSKKDDELKQIEADIDDQILLDDINSLMEEEGYTPTITDEGVVDDIAELQAQKDSGMFNTEVDVLSAWQAGVLNVPEYFDETYKVLNNKLKYLKPPESGLAPEWSEYGQAKKFVDVYNAFGKDEIIQLAKDFPTEIDLIDPYKAKLAEYADELGVEPKNLIDVIKDAKSIVGYTPLTETNLPKAFETGDIYPKKATEYSRDPLAMPPGMTATDRAASKLGFNDTVYHLAVNEDEFTQFKNIDDLIPEVGKGPTDKFQGTPHDLLGVHVGTARAAAERNKIKSGSVFNKDRPRFTMELRARLDKPVRPEQLANKVGLDLRDLTLTEDELNFTEGDLRRIIKQKAKQMNPKESYISTTMENKAAIELRKELAEAGYTHIPYENSLEDIESISYIMLIDRPKDSPAVLRDFRAEFDPAQRANPDLRMAEGGAVGDMNRQMELFARGGLKDDGMNMDPVSGNEVPSGSLAKEVRDDIPAQLSEGEYVVPADVVRYYGVKFFEDLRDQAKMGLTEMEANGRIGGEPVMDQGVTEEDLAALDQMLTTGAYNGGLMDKLEYAAKNDPIVNQRLNQGGMVVGFAEGGMTQSLYSDPTQIDMVINKVMAAARQNPEIMEQLSARGIQINRTEPQMPPQQMDQANPPQEARQGFDEGGNVVPMPGVPGPNAPMEQRTSYITSPTTVNPIYSVPGASYTYAEDGALPTPKPQEPVASPEYCNSIGMMFDPTTNACVPKPQAQTSDDDGTPAVQAPKWFEKYDYTDPTSVYQKSMNMLGYTEEDEKEEAKAEGLLGTIGGKIGEALGGIFEGGMLGGVIKQQKAAEAMANASLLAAMGYEDEAEKLRTQVAAYRDANDLKTGGFFDSTKTLTRQLADSRGMIFNEETGAISRVGGTGAVKPVDKPAPTTTTPSSSGDDDDGPSHTEIMQQHAELRAQRERADAQARASGIAQQAADAGTTIAEQTQTGSGGYGPSSQAEEATGGQGSQGLGSGAGGMYKGGLMKRPKR